MIAIPILSICFSSPAWPQENPQESADAQRCNGELQVSAQEQIASCSALIDSRSFSGKTLAILHSNRGIIWFEQTDYYKAVVDFDEAIALDPQDATSFYHRGLAKLKIGDTSGNADLGKAEELNPEFRAAKANAPSLPPPSRARKSTSSKALARSKNLSSEEVDRPSKKEVDRRREFRQRDQWSKRTARRKLLSAGTGTGGVLLRLPPNRSRAM
jgi:tetratricopeptide (TPR) repeat protein